MHGVVDLDRGAMVEAQRLARSVVEAHAHFPMGLALPHADDLAALTQTLPVERWYELPRSSSRRDCGGVAGDFCAITGGVGRV
jgi:cytosine/adenosine deaminase-related metal-dependent hydrolase